MGYDKEFDFVIINDDLEIAKKEAFQKVTDFIHA